MSFEEASQDARWREAMNKELHALQNNRTWSLVHLPQGKRAIGSKWVYKIKYNPDGTIERCKARLVAKGYSQVEGLDYNETFAPVAKFATVKCLLAVAAARKWELHQLDVNNAFLNGDLDEEVFMKVPEGYPKQEKGIVCRLHKSLYGLKQSSRQWFGKLSEALLTYGFKQSISDSSLFTLSKGDTKMVVLVYVDDLIVAGNNNRRCDQFKKYLQSCFQIKDLGALHYFLGLEVMRTADGIHLCQGKYTRDIITEAGLKDAKHVETPIPQHHGLSNEDGELLDDAPAYRRLVGRLLYLTLTRPDLTYAVHLLSQFMQKPRKPHMEMAKRVVRYLAKAPDQGILYPTNNSLVLKAYGDADWGTCPTSRRSVTGFVTFLGVAPLTWRSKKQPTVSLSSAEAEYRAMAKTTKEIIWLIHLLEDIFVEVPKPVNLLCDNKSAIHIATNPVFHERTKHIELDCHFIREKVQLKVINLVHVTSTQQLADIFTKALGSAQFQKLLRDIGVESSTTRT